MASNPEFLKEGAAVEDFMRPDRIVIGVDATPEGERARELLKSLYAPFNRNHERTYWMDVRSAEFTKYAANAMLATRISFMNELANLADKVGVDIEAVRHGIGSDPRIGYSFLYAGCGYGGSCFPKDVQALERTARGYGQELLILRAVEAVNDQQKQVLGGKIVTPLRRRSGGPAFRRVGPGLQAEHGRHARSVGRVLLADLLGARRHGGRVRPGRDGRGAPRAAAGPDAGATGQVRFADSPKDALQDADALAIVTEWKAFRSPDFEQIKARLKQPVIFDGRNLFEPAVMAEDGIEYHGIGRSILTRA